MRRALLHGPGACSAQRALSRLPSRPARRGQGSVCMRASPASSLDLWYEDGAGAPGGGVDAAERRASGAGASASGAPDAKPPRRVSGAAAAADAAVAAAAAAAPAAASAAQRSTHGGHGGRGASAASMDEQERELLQVSAALPAAEARLETLAAWVAAATAFGGGVWYVQGAEKAQEFFAGYLLEQSLSVDNLFVFVLVFNYFKTPPELQPKVLSYGIATAAVLRAVMILLGTELVERFEPVLVLFAGILLWSAYGLLFGKEDEDEDLSSNKIVMFCRRLLPVSDHYDGDRFFTSAAGPGPGAAAAAAAGAARVATPLLLALAVIEISDVVFAVDSIPAVFGVTLDPFIVYTSNLFAIMSLRSLYAFVSTVMTELRFLDKAVAIVLAFIGAKMLAEFGGAEVPTAASLLFVGAALGGGVAASLLLPEPAGGGKGE
ncbi:MAG: integral membrane protein TerC family-domain-containing protein [Monoraphidium minutum]|nr:MAG: integral membrane protein TerC family-domain-containing protein [Monoraphidium minutum]